MVTTKKNIPALRFPGFNVEWEEKKLGEISEINPRTKELPNQFVYIDLESVSKGYLLKESIISKKGAPSRAQRHLSVNDILFQMVRPYQQNNLFFCLVGNYVASTGYAQIRTTNNPKFLYYSLHTQHFVDKVIEKCTGTNYPAINSSDLSNISIKYPVLPEQHKIASFLSSMDERLQQLQQQKSLLEQYKKGCMRELFNRRLRLKEDKRNTFSDWGLRSLGEIVESISNGTSASQVTEETKFPVTRIETISKGNIDVSKVGFVNEFKGIESYRLLKGDLLFSNINSVAHIGKIALVDKEYNLYHGMNLLNIRLDKRLANPTFYYYLLSSPFYKRYFETICNQAVNQASINQTALKKTEILVPSLEEQTKIANFLSAIDEQINTVKQQIAQTQQFKKGLLQQLFV